MNNILYIGSFPPSMLIENSDRKIDSLYRDDEALISGFRSLKDVNIDVITSPDISSYPVNKIFYIKYYDEVSRALMVSSLNISIIKQLWTIFSMVAAAINIIKKNKGLTIVVIPYIVIRHTSVGRILQFLFRNKIKVAILVPDIFFPKNPIHKIINNIAENQSKHFDYFILYTKAMATHLKITSKPNIVIEGYHEVVDHEIDTPCDKFIVTYAGSLNINYGILRLLDAMKYLNHEDIELHLYGDGTGVQQIISSSQADNRIKYFGRVSKVIATNALYKSSALINPRNSFDGDFVQFSFPSKDIDYLASGIPCILCKLPGMPEGYYNYFTDAGQGSPNELAIAIQNLYNMNQSERLEIGKRAKQFITNRMDTSQQAGNILNLINQNI